MSTLTPSEPTASEPTPIPTPIPTPDALQGLVDFDPGAVDALRRMRVELENRGGLDERTLELVRLGALVALGAPPDSFLAHVRRARANGVPVAEIWGALLAVAPLVGVPRLMGAVPSVTAALG